VTVNMHIKASPSPPSSLAAQQRAPHGADERDATKLGMTPRMLLLLLLPMPTRRGCSKSCCCCCSSCGAVQAPEQPECTQKLPKKPELSADTSDTLGCAQNRSKSLRSSEKSAERGKGATVSRKKGG
jgi:hypothetical protein